MMVGLLIPWTWDNASDWLEVKMETEDSPDPDHSPTSTTTNNNTNTSQSSTPEPPLLPTDGVSPTPTTTNSSNTLLILTPPSAFADSTSTLPLHHHHDNPTSSQQDRDNTPPQQVRGTPNILQNCGGTFTIPGRFPPVPPPPPFLQGSGSGHCPRILGSNIVNSVREDTVHSAREDTVHSMRDDRGVSVIEPFRDTCAAGTAESVVEAAPSFAMSSVLQRGTPSIMASASMINSTFGLRSPSSCGAPSATRRTPVIMGKDSAVKGSNSSSTFAVSRSPFSFQPPPSGANTTRRTPCLLVTDSIMGNSTFGVQSSLCTTTTRANSSSFHRTPSILVTNSVMGNSTMKTPVTPLPPGSPTTPRQDPVAAENNNLTPKAQHPSATDDNSAPKPTPSVQPTETTSVWQHESPIVVMSQEPAQSLSGTTPERMVTVPADTEMAEEGEGEGREEQMMEVTPSPNSTAADELAECRARIDSFKSQEHELKDELQQIKGQFFVLLNSLGLSHDIYYNALTPADTPSLQRLDPDTLSLLTAASSLAQSHHHHQGNSPNPSSSDNNNSFKSGKMSTPRRRAHHHGRHHGVDMTTKYADLVLEQLLAKARSESNSSKSNSPPDLQGVEDQEEACGGGGHGPEGDRVGAPVPFNVDVNRDCEIANPKDSAKCKVIPALNGFHSGDDEGETTLLENVALGMVVGEVCQVPTVSPEAPLSSNTSSGSSAPTTSSTGSSSSSSSVPDLNKELVSRMHYYSDFTIDRQKKIDQAGRDLEAVAEASDESSPPSTSPEEQSGERISPRCVEGSDNADVFKAPFPPLCKPPVPTRQIAQLKLIRAKDSRGKGSVTSSDVNESDSSSGTGSMPRSQQSSRPPSSHYCSPHSSRHSSRDRHSARSSSGDCRSSGSSRGSGCSTHPLASSTFISNPNSHSPESGSVYTWSLDNSSDENLHQSFLRSSEKRQHKRSRPSRRKSKSSRSVASQYTRRPDTVIGADSPPQDKLGGAGETLHLTQEISVIDTAPRRFGGNWFENQCVVTPRSSSMPRTSTRIGGLLNTGGEWNQKALSSPELSHPCSDLNYAVSRIGPSNLPQTTHSDHSSTFKDRPDLPGKSSTSESTASYYSQCVTCNPQLLVPPEDGSVRVLGSEDACDDILTNSPNSYDSSGVQPPYNSYMSPAGSSNDYTTVSNSSQEHLSIVASAPRLPRAFSVKSPGVFKVPFSPASRTGKRKVATSGGHSTHNVGVRAVGTPHGVPMGLLKHKEPISRRKLFSVVHGQGSYHAPKVLDRKALVRKFKKFSNNFKKDKDSAKIHTLANL